MKYTYDGFPFPSKKFTICDAKISAIQSSDDTVRFVFHEGYSVISDGKVQKSPFGFIEFTNCDIDEFSCYIIQRESTSSGAQLFGKPISLSDLANSLVLEGKKIEIFLELYNDNYLYWRGVLLPHKMCSLSDNITIEIGGHYSMTYYWE